MYVYNTYEFRSEHQDLGRAPATILATSICLYLKIEVLHSDGGGRRLLTFVGTFGTQNDHEARVGHVSSAAYLESTRKIIEVDSAPCP